MRNNMNSRNYFNLFIATLCFALMYTPLLAAKPQAESGVTFPASSFVNETKLELVGTGTRKATIFGVKVYAAAYYAASIDSNAATHLAAKTPSKLMMIFLRNVTSDKLQKAWNEGIEKNSPGGFSKVAASLKKLNGLMKDVNAGDRFTFTFIPEKGVEAQIGRTPAVMLEDSSFVSALLSVWFGEHPPNKALKNGLLGIV